ncbi:MAG: hypothetical protein AAFO94_08640, partial [Bacteroidota bacterium]
SNGAKTKDIEGLGAESYLVTLTDANECDNTYEFAVEQPDSLMMDYTITQKLGEGFIKLLVHGGTGNYEYLWNNGATTDSIGNLSEGNYVAVVTDDNGCSLSANNSLHSASVLAEALLLPIWSSR